MTDRQTYDQLQVALDQLARLKRGIPEYLADPDMWAPSYFPPDHLLPIRHIRDAVRDALADAKRTRAALRTRSLLSPLQQTDRATVEAARAQLDRWRANSYWQVEVGSPDVHETDRYRTKLVRVSPLWLKRTQRYLNGRAYADDKFVVRMTPAGICDATGQQILNVVALEPAGRNKFTTVTGVVICHDDERLRTFGKDYATALRTFRQRAKKVVLERMQVAA